MRKTRIKFIVLLLVILSLTGCKNKGNYIMINGVRVKEDLLNSGYYFDVSTLSEIQLKDILDKIEPMARPNNLGDVKFKSNIEDIEIISKYPQEVTDQEIEAQIEKTRDYYQEEKIVTEKRSCQKGDIVVMNYVGKVDGVEIPGANEIDANIVLGQADNDFEKGIIGHTPGKNFSFTITLPIDYPDENLKGKKAIFSCLIKYIKETVTPEFDDEFAVLHSTRGATTSEAYRQEIKEDVQFRHEYAIEEENRNALYEKIYEIAECYPNDDGLAWEFNKEIVEQKRLAGIRDISNEMQLTNGYYTLYDVFASYKMQCKEYVKRSMILDALQKKYNISFTEEDKINWFNDLCIVNDYGDDVNYKFYSRSVGDQMVEDNARFSKIMNEVLKKVKIKIETKKEEE